MERPRTQQEVEELNDRLARDHDIDAYYEDSGFLIRTVERRRLDIIERMVDARRGSRILEVGCGGGHVLRLFPEARLTGVDVSGEMIAKARKNLAGYDVELLKGDLAELGLEDHSFDAVVCTEVLEHVLEPEAILEQIRRLAKPGGRVVITFPNDNLINAVKHVVRKSGLARVGPFERVEWGGDHYHLHVWSLREMRELLARYFRVVDEGFAPLRVVPIRCCFACVAR